MAWENGTQAAPDGENPFLLSLSQVKKTRSRLFYKLAVIPAKKLGALSR